MSCLNEADCIAVYVSGVEIREGLYGVNGVIPTLKSPIRRKIITVIQSETKRY